MIAIRSLLFALLFYPGTLVYVLGVILLSPLGDKTVQAIVHGWSAGGSVDGTLRSLAAPGSGG